MFAYFSGSKHSPYFSLFQKKNLFWLRPGGAPPPPFTDWSVTYRFFYAFPSSYLISWLNSKYNVFSYENQTYMDIKKHVFLLSVFVAGYPDVHEVYDQTLPSVQCQVPVGSCRGCLLPPVQTITPGARSVRNVFSRSF